MKKTKKGLSRSDDNKAESAESDSDSSDSDSGTSTDDSDSAGDISEKGFEAGVRSFILTGVCVLVASLYSAHTLLILPVG